MVNCTWYYAFHAAWLVVCRRPHIFLDMRVVDENGKVVPHDGKTFGDLEVKGPIAMRQYFKVSHLANRQLTTTGLCIIV